MRFNFTPLPFNRLSHKLASGKPSVFKKMMTLLLLMINAAALFAQPTTVFTDDFSTNTNAVYTTSGAIGGSAWTVLRSGVDMGGRRNETVNQLELSNDASASANVNGWVLAYTLTSSFSSPYNTTLNSNTGDITWTFNMRHPRTDPSGFSGGNYGAAYILAGTSTTTLTAGTGYAIVTGQSGSTDPIRLVRYGAGFGTLTNLITSNTTGLTDFGTEYLSIKVVYTPSTNNWQLFLRNDGATAFADPAAGTLISQGNVVDNTYTGTTLTYMGALWNSSTAANQIAFYDNVKVTSTPPCTPPAISAISNSGTVCDTASLQLNVTASGTATLNYSWTGPSGYTSTDEDPLVATPHSGYYVVTVSNACGSAKDSTLSIAAASQSWYADGDTDGFGAGAAVIACTQPVGYVSTSSDCNDGNAAINPLATEICNTLDDDCDGQTDDADPSITGQGTYYADLDNDTYGTGTAILACIQPSNTSLNNTDCNDANQFINPGVSEVCGNTVDDNCNGSIDEGCGTFTYYFDNDNDGFGVSDSFIVVVDTVPPAGYSIFDTDCNDTLATVNPAATEICNGIDDDCDNLTDNADSSVTGQFSYYADADNDTYGAGTAILSCTQPIGTSVNNTDCNDGNAAVNPGATEICNGVDDDCDTFIDDADSSITGQNSYYIDTDNDGYGTGTATLACTQPIGYSALNTDCNDTIAAVNPGATEICNGIDDDCDLLVDDADSSVTGRGTFYADIDGDGFGTGSAILACVQPIGTSINNTDCNDTIAAINPGATDIPSNGIDENCNGIIDDLSVGDIMILAARFDDTDAFAFVTWKDLAAGTQLRFTDNAWTGTALLTNEQTTIWTANTFIPAGTVIVAVSTATNATFDIGTATGTLSGLSTSGDNLFVYQGVAASPRLIFGYHNDGTTWQTTGANNTNSSYLPAVLNVSNGNIAIAEVDNAQFNGARSGLTFAQYKTNILTPSNWLGDDGGSVLATLSSTDFFDVNSLQTGTVATSFCITATDSAVVSIPYTANIPFVSGNIFTAQLSDASGSFTAPVILGSVASTVSGVINGIIPSSVAAGTGYRIRVVASNPAGPGTDNGSNITINKVIATASNNSPICAGQLLTLTADGGVSYSWSGPNGFTSSSPNPFILNALVADSGVFTVIVTDAIGCADTVSTLAVVQDCGCFPPNLSSEQANVNCFGSADGMIDLTVTGIATPPYTYSWSNGATTEDVSGLAAGIYTVVVTDSLGCSDSLTVTISEPADLVVSHTFTNPVCFGDSTGSINVTTSGGTIPYSFEWSNGASTEDISNLPAGSYSLTVSDINGCIENLSVSIVQPQQLEVTLNSALTFTCDSNSLGTINISVSNDTLTNPNNPGLLISEFLSNPAGVDSSKEWVELVATRIINFAVTPYTVIVANNGVATTKGWVEGNSSITPTNSTYAFEITSGTVNPGDIVYVGGSAMSPTGVKLRVINNSTTGGDGGIGGANSTGVFGNGTTNADGIAIFNLPASAIDSNTVPVDAILYGTAVGGAALAPEILAGFTLPVNDHYSGGRIAASSFLAPDPGANYVRAAGVYNISSGVYTTPRLWSTNAGFTNQATSVNVTSVNTYLWSNSSTDQDLTNIIPGTYTVSVTSQLGCTVTDTFTLNVPIPPSPVITPGDSVLCDGQEIFLSVSDAGGFSNGYPQGTTVDWLGINSGLSPDDSVSSINGPYFIAQVSVPGGCVGKSDTVLVITQIITVTPMITNESCGSGNGKIVINTAGGVAPFRYVWSNGRDTVTNSATDSIYNLSSGSYNVVVYDNYGGVVIGEPSCASGIIAFSISSQAGPTVTVTSHTNVTCSGAGDGTATATVTNGVAPYNYLWSNGDTSATATALIGDTYYVTVTDANGCTAMDSIIISDPDPISISVNLTHVTVCGGNDGSAVAIVTGGTPGFLYQWFDGNATPLGPESTDSTITGLIAGSYFIQVFDTNECSNFISFDINQECDTNVVTLSVKVYIEGYASAFGAPQLPMSPALFMQGVSASDTEVDTIKVELRDASDYTIVVETANVILDTGGYAVCTFTNAVNGSSYWISVSNRTAVQIYSAAPVLLATGNNYNFTSGSFMTFGENVRDIFGDGSAWAMYTGDIFDGNIFDLGQDGFIDILDYLILDADLQAGQAGYYATDLNGDGFVDVFDYLLLDLNVQSGISVITPL